MSEVTTDDKSDKKSEKTAKKVAKAPSAPISKVEDATLPLAEILADWSWNCRAEMRTRSEGTRSELDGDPDAPGVEGIAGSLEMMGRNSV